GERGGGGGGGEDGGGGGEGGDPVAFDQVDHGGGVELLHQDQPVPREQAVEGGEAVGVVHRGGDQDRLRAGHWHGVPHVDERSGNSRVVHPGPLGEDHLRGAGGAAAADAVQLRRDHVGKVGYVKAGRAVDPAHVAGVKVDPRLDDLPQP